MLDSSLKKLLNSYHTLRLEKQFVEISTSIEVY